MGIRLPSWFGAAVLWDRNTSYVDGSLVSFCCYSYCDPAYAFPPQKDVIRFAVNLVRDALYENPNLLVVTGTYTIGKERIFMGKWKNYS